MNDYAFLPPLVGGILIGLGSLVAAALSGKVPGISGVFARLLMPATTDKEWRFIFLLGLIGGAAVSFLAWESADLFRPVRPLWTTAVAGLLVGLGTRIGGGCTSGHGVCGVGTAAKDSIVATMVFVGTAMVTVLIYNRAIQ